MTVDCLPPPCNKTHNYSIESPPFFFLGCLLLILFTNSRLFFDFCLQLHRQERGIRDVYQLES